MEAIEFLKSVDTFSWVATITFILVVIGLYIKRKSPYVKEVVTNTIMEAEKMFNSGEGQQKLKFAVTAIRAKLPMILRIFITHRMLVTMIEGTLNKISDSFDLDRKVDIKGNEMIVPKKIVIEKKDNMTSFELDTREPEVEVEDGKSNTELYASLKAKTDWRKDTETSVEVGIKKKF